MQRQIEKLKQLEAYHFIEQSKIEELSTTAVIMEHKKTKARILLILADDKNKVFTIGFRTDRFYRCGSYCGAHCALWVKEISE